MRELFFIASLAMDAAAAGGGEVAGDPTMATSRLGGGSQKPRKAARAITGMAGGAGEFSYTRNSLIQSESIKLLKPILEQEMQELALLKDWSGSGSAIRIADFGCSVGENALRYAEICYRNVCRARLRSNAGSNAAGRTFPDEVQYFFCDLPSNDFNTLFLQLEDWRNNQTSMEDFYATAIPGSFHRRLLPRGSLHVAISAFAVHWMSQVPDEVLDKSSPAYNKGKVGVLNNVNIAALQAFKQIARQDLCNFLQSRADEVVSGGLVFFYTWGYADEYHSEDQWPREGVNLVSFYKVFEATWEELVIEGTIEEERRDTFNVPVYCHSMDDVKVVVESTNAFHIKRCEIKRQSYFPPNEVEKILGDPEAYGQFTKKFMRSLMNSIMVEHIGEEKCHKFFGPLERNATTAAREKRVSFMSMDCILAILIRK